MNLIKRSPESLEALLCRVRLADYLDLPTYQLPQIFAVAHNFALNLCRSNEFSNMAQAEGFYKFYLDTLKTVFRMK
jgi:hypothetical protein